MDYVIFDQSLWILPQQEDDLRAELARIGAGPQRVWRVPTDSLEEAEANGFADAVRTDRLVVPQLRELVLVLHRDAWGAPVSPEEHARLCSAAEAWLTEHEGAALSIRVRPSRAGEVEGLRALRGGIPDGPNLQRSERELAELTNRAWEAALKTSQTAAK